MTRVVEMYKNKSKEKQEYLAKVLQERSDAAEAAIVRIAAICKMIDDAVAEKKAEDARKLAENERK